MQAAIGGAVVTLVVAGGLRLRKLADEGYIDVDYSEAIPNLSYKKFKNQTNRVLSRPYCTPIMLCIQ